MKVYVEGVGWVEVEKPDDLNAALVLAGVDLAALEDAPIEEGPEDGH